MVEQADVRAALQALFLGAGRADGWLAQQRWYADKGRTIASCDVLALRLDPVPEGTLALVVAQFQFKEGEPGRYFLPLHLAPPGEGRGAAIGHIGHDAVYDATTSPWFGSWLLQAFREQAAGWLSDIGPAGAEYLERAAAHPAQVLRGEQSNTSIRFGDVIIVKLFRKLQSGVNPDEEALRALSTRGFAHAPAFVGSLAWLGPGDVQYPVALATSFVSHQADGWSWLLARLADLAAGGAIDVEPERLLGQRTAEMHLALASASENAFTPVPASAIDIAQSKARTRAALRQAEEIIRERAEALPPAVRATFPVISAALRRANLDVAGYDAELGLSRIRTHGDYHLGQTLRTDHDWVIVDFEGEPARPVQERRQPASALKDVAGMLRSFAYARGASALSLPEEGRELVQPRLREWETAARDAFLAAYRETIGGAHVDLVPRSDVDFARALRAWEVDKALYEIAYEARNRPTWLAIPLAALTPT